MSLQEKHPKRNSSRNKWRGVTLVELIAVIGIIAILVSLALPAVHAARVAARRISCASNLRQIALAASQYHDVFRRLPSGTSSARSRSPFQGWMVSLTPYVEKNQIFVDAVDDYRRTTYFPEHRNFPKAIGLFACPEDDRVQSTQFSIRHNYNVALTSYLGCNGTDSQSRNGVLYYASEVRFSGISDGLSNTILVAERPPSPFYDLGWWYAGVGDLFRSGSLDHTMGTSETSKSRYADCDQRPQSPQPGKLTDECSANHFWSLHSGGLHLAMADSSVRFFVYGSNRSFDSLGTRNGHEVVSDD
jgi:prepilin-type N-terminal cleavage/methylation domain-containing protein